jgi:hypothetical protein
MTFADIVIFLGALAVSGVSVYLVQKYWPHEHRKEHNDVTGAVFAGVGQMFAVLLAFVVIVMWENLNSARDETSNEANQLATVYWLSRSLPLPRGAAIETLTLSYAHTVIDKEWPLMVTHDKSSIDATHLVYRIRDAVFGFVPRTAQQQVLYQEAVSSVDAFAAARRGRLNELDGSIPQLLWAVLIIGALINFGLCLIFGLRNRKTHIWLVAALATSFVISLLLIWYMEYPFAGPMRIGPEAFQVFLSRLPPPR